MKFEKYITKINEDIKPVSDYIKARQDWAWHIERGKEHGGNPKKFAIDLGKITDDIDNSLSKLSGKIKKAEQIDKKLLKVMQTTTGSQWI